MCCEWLQSGVSGADDTCSSIACFACAANGYRVAFGVLMIPAAALLALHVLRMARVAFWVPMMKGFF
jgi:hypothetical protein